MIRVVLGDAHGETTTVFSAQLCAVNPVPSEEGPTRIRIQVVSESIPLASLELSVTAAMDLQVKLAEALALERAMLLGTVEDRVAQTSKRFEFALESMEKLRELQRKRVV